MRNLRRGGSPSSKLGNASKRMTNKGTSIWYVFVDESGRPDYNRSQQRFFMDAIVTDDPEMVASFVLTKAPIPKGLGLGDPIPAPGSREMKHKELAREPIEAVLKDIKDYEIKTFSSAVKKEFSGRVSDGHTEYMRRLSDLVRLIVKEGPPGLYCFRLDYSPFYNQDEVYQMIAYRFKGAKDKELLRHNPVMAVDSDLTPAIQTVDILVGEHRQRAHGGSEAQEKFEKKYDIKVSPNRKQSSGSKDERKARESQRFDIPGLHSVVSESRMNRRPERVSRRCPAPDVRKSLPFEDGVDHPRTDHSGVTSRITAARLKKKKR